MPWKECKHKMWPNVLHCHRVTLWGQDMTVSPPKFPQPGRMKIVEELHALKPLGRHTTFSKTRRRRTSCDPKMPACRVCRRMIRDLGRVICPGWVTCDDPGCRLAQPGSVTRLFETPYGRALTRSILATFCEVTRLPTGRMVVVLAPILARAHQIADGYLDLLQWQRAYDAWDRFRHPETYALGQVAVIPPRTLDHVLAFRVYAPPTPLDPTRHLPDDVRREIRAVRAKGIETLSLPF